MNTHDALLILVDLLRQPDIRGIGNYGYDLYIPYAIRQHLLSQRVQEQEMGRRVSDLSPQFYNAAWELCRRGILRPGVRAMGAQVTDDGSGGNGYSVTPFGKQWLADAAADTFVPTEPDRFAEMLAPYRNLFGPGFHERAQQAIQCYGAHAYLACCAMCGAAAESILLAAAIAKSGDESAVLREYSAASGRVRLEARLFGQAPEAVRREYQGLAVLLRYWRDLTSHGRATAIADNEAYTSLALLLRLGMFIKEHWLLLTGARAT